MENYTLPSGMELRIDREGQILYFIKEQVAFAISAEDYWRSQGCYTKEVKPPEWEGSCCVKSEDDAETM